MANINAPAHDFAPPWLKIPSYDSSQKVLGAERGSHSSRREGHSYGLTRPAKESEHFYHRHSQYSNDSRHDKNTERKSSYISSYHQSLDFDDSRLEGSAVFNSNAHQSYNGTSSNSQSALLRRPHSRHDFRNIPSAYIKVEPVGRHGNNSTNSYYGNKTKGKVSESGNSGFNDNGAISVGSNNFNQEFPSLQGDISEEPSISSPSVNGSVWEKPRNMKVHAITNGKKLQLIKKPVASDSIDCARKGSSLSSSSSSSSVLSSCDTASSTCNSHTVIITPVAKGGVYRALIPAKAATSKKTLSKDGTKLGPPKKLSVTPPPSSTHSMEILVKHPKAPGNKSEFLKTLRNENKDSTNHGEVETSTQSKREKAKENESNQNLTEEPHENGIDISNLSVDDDDEGDNVLSSSLKAERRLLHEMGWKEEVSDDDNYAPLTEEEMKEFRAQMAKNGFRRNLQINLSPKRLIPSVSDVTSPIESDSSSSDSDFDV